MTNIYAHLTDSDAPKNQHITEVSFVDEAGKHVDIAGGTSDITHDDTLTGSGTADSPLKLSDTVTADIAKGKEITKSNFFSPFTSKLHESAYPVGYDLDTSKLYVGFTASQFSIVWDDPKYPYIRLNKDLLGRINGAIQSSQLSAVTPVATPESATIEDVATLLNQLITALTSVPVNTVSTINMDETI